VTDVIHKLWVNRVITVQQLEVVRQTFPGYPSGLGAAYRPASAFICHAGQPGDWSGVSRAPLTLVNWTGTR